jgi:putative phosphoesterase
MKILIVSDSHRMNGNLKIAIDREKPDMLIHLGDIESDTDSVALWAGAPKTPCIFIKGNCDRYSGSDELRDTAIFPLKGHKFYCCHGHHEFVHYDLTGLCIEAATNECDIALFGHTHVPYDSWGDAFKNNKAYKEIDPYASAGIRVLNPGSISLPRGGSHRTYMVMEIKDDGNYTVILKNL